MALSKEMRLKISKTLKAKNIKPHRIQVLKLLNNNFKKYIYDVRNGITLCRSCHILTFKKK